MILFSAQIILLSGAIALSVFLQPQQPAQSQSQEVIHGSRDR